MNRTSLYHNMSTPEEEMSAACTISVNPLHFSDLTASGWFTILEAHFSLKGITTSAVKYYTALSSLTPSLVRNLPIEVSENECYEGLKSHVINAHKQNKLEIFKKLAQKTTMTEQPSIYLRELLYLASKTCMGEYQEECHEQIRIEFIRALPVTMSHVIASQTSLSLMQLGNLADELMLLHNLSNLDLNQKSADATSKSVGNRWENSSHSLPIDIRPFNPNQRPRICRAHIYFADMARTCKPWCTFPNKNYCKIEPSSRPPSPSSESYSRA